MAQVVSQFPNVLKVYLGTDAFKKVLNMRYQPHSRTRVRRMYKNDNIADSILVIYHDRLGDSIEYRFYPDKNHADINDEGDSNMFGSYPIQLYLMSEETRDSENLTPYIKKTNTFLRSLL
jgi:hypothetical protein